jgi:prepilin peptidase CpaA
MDVLMQHILVLALLPTLMMVAAVSDCLSLRIPNWLTGLVALLFFPMALLTGMPLADFGWHLLGGVILFVAGYALFSFGVFGGGDAKLMAAAGLWFGTDQSLPFLMMTVLAGGILAVAVMSWSLFVTFADLHGLNMEKGIGKAASKIRPKLPYGLAFAVGAIVVYPQSWWMVSALSGAV